jgi:hypothetical protein
MRSPGNVRRTSAPTTSSASAIAARMTLSPRTAFGRSRSNDPSWCQPRRGFTRTRGGVGRRTVAASARPIRIEWERTAASESRRRLDPPAHAIRRRSRRSRAQSESRPGSSVSAGAWIRPQASRLPTICGDRPELSLGCVLSRVEASGARRSSTFRLGIPIITTAVGRHGRSPRAPACGFRSRLTENRSPRPSPRFFESPRDMRR